jgi:CRP-like cAMP-binding protein
MPLSQERSQITNRILRVLPAATWERLRPALEPVRMERDQTLGHVDGPIRYMYFINRGLVSLVKTMLDGRSVEIEAVGIEGITDPVALLGIDRAILDSVVQVPGSALRIGRDALGDAAAADAALRAMMQNYARIAMNQLSQTAACNRLHSLEERFCRWLLIAHDSALADSFPLTHEFVATMLGVRRSSVSIAASFLKKAGLIDYSRGRVAIRNRAGLEEAACECYGVIRKELDALFGARG